MTAIVQTDSWLETGGCDGPRFTRHQPSREETGVTMTEIQDKYIPEFELPYRNVERYVKEIQNNWNRLDSKQRQALKTSLGGMGLSGVETFKNECKCTGKKGCKCGKGEIACKGKCKEGFSDNPSPSPSPSSTFTSTHACIHYQDWRAWLVFIFFVMIILLIGIGCGNASAGAGAEVGGGGGGDKNFGKRFSFGRR